MAETFVSRHKCKATLIFGQMNHHLCFVKPMLNIPDLFFYQGKRL